MEIFHIWDVTSLLGLPQAPSGRSSYYIPCPCCDSRPKDRHLNINLRKEVFRCPRCGVSGGIFDLYALYTDVPRDRVRKCLVEKLGMPENRKRSKKSEKAVTGGAVKRNKETALADIEVRNKAYAGFLAKLPLASDHRDSLMNRGLKPEEIDMLGYRTTMESGLTGIAEHLHDSGLVLAGVPGFYETKEGLWSFVHTGRGILIPVRDRQGRIQGMQLRLDHVKKRKFRWISSTEMRSGCRAEGWIHIAGNPGKKILLTEGPMKADIIHVLTGFTVLAVPGVNALTQLEAVLLELKENGLTEIMTAFDMDMAANPHVQKGYQNMLALIDKMGFRFGTYLWDGAYKGLDDYVWEYLYRCNRA